MKLLEFRRQRLETLTTSATLTPAQLCKTLLVNGSGAVTLTLPSPLGLADGTWVDIFNVANQNLVVQCANLCIIGGDGSNNSAASSVTFSTASKKTGAAVRCVVSGAVWLVTIPCGNPRTVA